MTANLELRISSCDTGHGYLVLTGVNNIDHNIDVQHGRYKL